MDESHRDLSSDDFARGGAIVPYTLPWWHPEIQFVAVNEVSSDRRMYVVLECIHVLRFIVTHHGALLIYC